MWVLGSWCCLGGTSASSWGVKMCRQSPFNGRASAEFDTSPWCLGCPDWWLHPVNYSSVATSVREAILQSAWQYLSVEILRYSHRNSSKSLMRTVLVIRKMNPFIAGPAPSQLICHQQLKYSGSNTQNIWCIFNVSAALLDSLGACKQFKKSSFCSPQLLESLAMLALVQMCLHSVVYLDVWICTWFNIPSAFIFSLIPLLIKKCKSKLYLINVLLCAKAMGG